MLNLAQTGAILVGVALTVMDLRHMRQTRDTELETRQAQLFMQIYDRFESSEFQRNDYLFMQWEWGDFEDFRERYGDAESYSIHSSIGTFYEGIGVLMNRGLIDVELVDDLMSGCILRYWEKIKPVNDMWRERYRWPQSYEWLEYLYGRIKPLAERQHPEIRK